MKKVCITGVTGNVGATVAEMFLKENIDSENPKYKVYGLKRRTSSTNTERIDHFFNDKNFKLIYGDITDPLSIDSYISQVKPDIYINCAAQSHVRIGFDIPLYTSEATGLSIISMLESIKKYVPECRVVHMSSSEMFGSSVDPDGFQRETTKFHPRSIYACAKLFAHHACINYREAYNMNVTTGILFNIEGKNRGFNFATRKATISAARCSVGLQDKVFFGNLNSYRDWSLVDDSSRALILMATTDKPSDDYVVASGKTHSVEEFCKLAFERVGLNYKDYVEYDERLLRPTEVDYLCGDASKLKRELGWEPKYNFNDIVNIMVDHDLELAKRELILKNLK